MIAKFKPGLGQGTIFVPPSKSFTHRFLIAASLADGESTIRNILFSDDTMATMDCLTDLGATIDVSGTTAKVTGRICPESGTCLEANESGSTIRMIMPLCWNGKDITFNCASTLSRRPFEVYENICRDEGIKFEHDEDSFSMCGTLAPGTFTVPGNISSQFISGLLFALPTLSGDSEIKITEPIESLPYIDMTIMTLSLFGVKAFWTDSDTISVPGGQKYVPANVTVEGDWSNGAFYKALSAVGGKINILGLDDESIQGDRNIVSCLSGIKRGFPLIDISNFPDIGPLLFAVAAARNGAAFKGTERLKYKETDRLGCMEKELEKMGVTMVHTSDFIKVTSYGIHAPSEPLSGHGDHRIIMALSLLLSIYGGEITDAETVGKSYPEFFEDIKKLGIDVTLC